MKRKDKEKKKERGETHKGDEVNKEKTMKEDEVKRKK